MGKLAIVTGSGQGIGEGIVYRLAKDGFAVAVADINPQTAKNVAKTLIDKGFEAKAYVLDVANRSAVFQLIEQAVSDFGELAVFVNNAGVAFIDSIIDSDSERVERLFDVNIKVLIGEYKQQLPNLKNKVMADELSMRLRLQVLKVLPCKVLILLQNLQYVD